MIITIFGDGLLKRPPTILTDKLFENILSERTENKDSAIYIGNICGFSRFAYKYCKKFSKNHPNVKLVYVSKRLDIEHQQFILRGISQYYDKVICPNLEYKNGEIDVTAHIKWMIDQADFIIIYSARENSVISNCYKYALQLQKNVFNIANYM